MHPLTPRSTLILDIADELGGTGIPLVAAGGIADGRGVVAALGAGAAGVAGVAMGTRFLASTEAQQRRLHPEKFLDFHQATSKQQRYIALPKYFLYG
jgi:NAD(P)H-dependent flavin oxidoreductase YrpB (nitropropane dioxygenase family)